MFRELTQHDAIPTESKLNEVTICDEHTNLKEVQVVIPATTVLHLDDLKTTTFHYQVEKAKHREVLSKWCVPRGREHTITVAAKIEKSNDEYWNL